MGHICWDCAMHKRYQGESFLAYLDRVERDMMEQARHRLDTATHKRHERRRYTGSMQTDFWLVSSLMQEQNSRCYWCCRLLIGEKFHVDHVYPRAKGGADSRENLRVSCKPCNMSKNDTLPMDFVLSRLS